MAATITLIIFVTKLCQLTVAVIDPSLIYATAIVPDNISSTTLNVNFDQSNGNERRPETDSYLQNQHIMRDKRNVKRSEKNFIRLGRDGEEYSRYVRADKNLIRFGRNDNSKGNGFIRFGRSDKGLIRFGRNDNDDMRFGRRGDKFIRFGRSNGGIDIGNSKDNYLADDNLNSIDNSFQPSRPISRPGRNDKYIRFGRGDHGFIRLGKKNELFKYTNGMPMIDNVNSEEKVNEPVVDQDDISVPLQLYIYDVLDSERDSGSSKDNESNVSAGTPLDDDYLLNDKNLVKNNLV